MAYYPVFLNIRGRETLVVGGGGVAERKAEGLLRFEAKVRLVARDLTSRLRARVKAGEMAFLGRAFEERHLEGIFLVIAATSDEGLNRRIASLAKARGILVNAVDQPEDCTFILPSILQRGDLVVAVSTSGKSPAMAGEIRRRLEPVLGSEYAPFLTLMGRIRERILKRGLPQEENSRLFQGLVRSELLQSLRDGDGEKARAVLSGLLPPDIDLESLLQGVS